MNYHFHRSRYKQWVKDKLQYKPKLPSSLMRNALNILKDIFPEILPPPTLSGKLKHYLHVWTKFTSWECANFMFGSHKIKHFPVTFRFKLLVKWHTCKWRSCNLQCTCEYNTDMLCGKFRATVYTQLQKKVLFHALTCTILSYYRHQKFDGNKWSVKVAQCTAEQ